MEGGGSVVGWARHGTAPGDITERLMNENIERGRERETERTYRVLLRHTVAVPIIPPLDFQLHVLLPLFFLGQRLVRYRATSNTTDATRHKARSRARSERRGVRPIREEQRRGQGESPAKRRVPYHATYTHRRIWYVFFNSVGLEQGGKQGGLHFRHAEGEWDVVTNDPRTNFKPRKYRMHSSLPYSLFFRVSF